MTTIAATMTRSYTPDMFDDLTDVPHVRTFDRPSGVTTLTFDGVLPPEVEHAIWARMESRDDADQSRRATLRADRDALPADDPLRRLYDYTLGD